MNRHTGRYIKLLSMVVLLLLVAVACGSNAMSASDEIQNPTTENLMEAWQPGEPVALSEEEVIATDAPVLESAPAMAGQPLMTALVNLNVRRGPGTGYVIVGVLRSGGSARIVGQNTNGSWWKIECPPGLGGDCWASAGAQFSQAENVSSIPIVAAPPLPTQAPGAIAEAPPDAETPATSTPSAAAPETPNPTPMPTAMPTPASPTQKPELPTPTVTSTPSTQPTQEPTPTAEPVQPTPTPEPSPPPAGPPIAPFDGDSINNPAVFVNFSPTGEREFTFSNDVSTPEGDLEDWVRFKTVASQSPSARVWLTVVCNGNSPEAEQRFRVTLWDGFEERLSLNARCGDNAKQLTVLPNHTYNARIHIPSSGGPYYVQYTLTVRGRQ